jgi:hypothetical protein
MGQKAVKGVDSRLQRVLTFEQQPENHGAHHGVASRCHGGSRGLGPTVPDVRVGHRQD